LYIIGLIPQRVFAEIDLIKFESDIIYFVGPLSLYIKFQTWVLFIDVNR
jgi:hypothetical protein